MKEMTKKCDRGASTYVHSIMTIDESGICTHEAKSKQQSTMRVLQDELNKSCSYFSWRKLKKNWNTIIETKIKTSNYNKQLLFPTRISSFKNSTLTPIFLVTSSTNLRREY